jgi:hypothetical protein
VSATLQLQATAVVAAVAVLLTLSMLRTLPGQQQKQDCRSVSVNSMALSELWLYHVKRYYCVTACLYHSVINQYSSMSCVTTDAVAVAATVVISVCACRIVCHTILLLVMQSVYERAYAASQL